MGRDEGWCGRQPTQPELGSTASIFQRQRVGSSIPRGFEEPEVVDLWTELPGKGCYQS